MDKLVNTSGAYREVRWSQCIPTQNMSCLQKGKMLISEAINIIFKQ